MMSFLWVGIKLPVFYQSKDDFGMSQSGDNLLQG